MSLAAQHEQFPAHGSASRYMGVKMTWASTGFTPSGSPEGHWSADTITGLSDGDPVGTWPDQSGNSHDATQATAAAKPTYKTNVQNGEPVVRFDGGDFLNMAWGSTLSLANTAFIVCALAATGAGNNYFFDGDNTGRNAFMIYSTNYAMHATSNILSDGAEDTNFHIFSMLFNDNSSILRNNTAESTGDAGPSGSDGITFGASNGDAAKITGDIAELVFYDGTESFTANEAGLNTKYAVY